MLETAGSIPAAGMAVCVVFYSKDKSHMPGKSEQISMDKKKKLSKASVCGRSLAEVAGSILAGSMDVHFVF